MWAIGCILYEALYVATYIQETDDKYSRVLFKGESSFPLSPKADQEEQLSIGADDQLY